LQLPDKRPPAGRAIADVLDGGGGYDTLAGASRQRPTPGRRRADALERRAGFDYRTEHATAACVVLENLLTAPDNLGDLRRRFLHRESKSLIASRPSTTPGFFAAIATARSIYGTTVNDVLWLQRHRRLARRQPAS
jgi:hypothetical protein